MTGGTATVLERVRGLIERLAPEPVCDDCIAEKLAVTQASQVNLAAHELAGAKGIERRGDICALCGNLGIATRQASR